MSVAAWMIASLVTMAFVEYAAHRWPMHSKRFVRRFPFMGDVLERHATLHHGRFYREAFDKDVDPVARHVNIDLDPGFALLLGAPIWVTLHLTGHQTGALCFAATSAAHALVWTAVHREMHDPRGRWFAGTRYYRYVRENHRKHHERPGCNFAVVMPPFVDKLFGTHC